MTDVKISGEESYVKKLSVATLGCVPAAVKQEPSGKLAIARIFGKMEKVGTQEDVANAKIYRYLQGTFEGINMQDGTVLRSSRVFLPEGIQQVVEIAYENAVKAAAGPEGKGKYDGEISFAFEIRAVKANNPAGYSYEAVALRDPQQEDALGEMRKALAGIPTLEQKRLQAQHGGKEKPALEGKAAKSA